MPCVYRNESLERLPIRLLLLLLPSRQTHGSVLLHDVMLLTVERDCDGEKALQAGGKGRGCWREERSITLSPASAASLSLAAAAAAVGIISLSLGAERRRAECSLASRQPCVGVVHRSLTYTRQTV